MYKCEKCDRCHGKSLFCDGIGVDDALMSSKMIKKTSVFFFRCRNVCRIKLKNFIPALPVFTPSLKQLPANKLSFTFGNFKI